MFYHNYFRDREGSQNLIWIYTSILLHPVRWNFHVWPKYLERWNSSPSFSIATLYIVELCEYAFAIGFPLYVPKNGFGGFEGEYVKILYYKLQKALTCMNTRLYRVT